MLTLATALLAFQLPAATPTPPPARPNVILVMADDLGYGDVGFLGPTRAKTPELDAIAREALVFRRFYAAAPVCSPTRGSVLTGRHPSRLGIPNANAGHLDPRETTIAELLRARGYRTAHFGKWHLGTLTTQVRDANRGRPGDPTHYTTPADHGYDLWCATESKVPTWDPLRRPKEFGPGQSLQFGWLPVADDDDALPFGTAYWDGVEHTADGELAGDDARILVDRVIPFVADAVADEKPFFVTLWLHTPHLPVVAGDAYRAPFADRPLRQQLYFGAIAAMDEQIGRLRRTLRELDVAADTMLWFASDNGPERDTPGSAGPLRGRKRSLYEGGVRVPALLAWPARITTPRTTDVPAVTSDYLPTILDALGVPEDAWPADLDGVSLLPQIDGAESPRARPIGFDFQGAAALSDNRFKLYVPADDPAELYDLLADPGEAHDLATTEPERVTAMRAALDAWRADCRRDLEGASRR